MRRIEIHFAVLLAANCGCYETYRFSGSELTKLDRPNGRSIKLETRDGKALWVTRSLEDARSAEILELHAEGKSVRAIAQELGMSKSAVQRALTKGKRQ